MKKLFNTAETMVDDMLDGFVSAYPQVKRGVSDPRVIVRDTNAKNPDEKVTLLIGNGSGHEPIAMGFIGQGLLDANVVGDVFAAPSADLILDGITEPNYNLSNRFLYEEWINATYVNYKREFGAINLQAGLRAESTQLKGNQLGNIVQPDSSFAYTYNTVFPTFYASWKADTIGKNTLTFTYGRRIDRPYFQDLNPFI